MLVAGQSPGVAGLLLPVAAADQGCALDDGGEGAAATAPPGASFNALLQSESFDAIKRDVDRLAFLARHFPSYQGLASRLSGDIMTSLGKIASLRERRRDGAAAAARAPSCASPGLEPPKTQRPPPAGVKPACRRCSAVTPQWRAGPAGRRTLCNVCGLVHSKRAERAAGKASARQPPARP